MQNLHIEVYQLIHLENREHVKVFVNKEQFHFMKQTGVSNAENKKFHNLIVNVV